MVLIRVFFCKSGFDVCVDCDGFLGMLKKRVRADKFDLHRHGRLTDYYCGWSAFNVGGIAFSISIRAFLDSGIVNLCMLEK